MGDQTENKPKKGLFSKILDAVTTTEEVVETATKTEPAAITASQTTTVTPTVVQSLPTTSGPIVNSSQPFVAGAGIVDNDVYAKIWARINAADQEGFDFLEFKKTMAGLDKVAGFTPAMKYQTAFNMLSGLGPITKESILDSLKVYLGVVNTTEEQFNQMVEEAYEEKVNVKISQANTKQKEIEELTAKVNALQLEIGELTTSANVEASKLDASKKNFAYTAQVIKQELTTEQANVETLITNQITTT